MSTYDELAADIVRYADDSSAAFAAALPSIIRMAQEEVNAVLNIKAQEVETTFAVPAGTQILTLPDGAVGTLSVKARYTYDVGTPPVATDSGDIYLRQQEKEYLASFDPTGAARGHARHYALKGADKLILCPIPDVTWNITLTYLAKPMASPAVQTTWLTRNHYGLLLACSMLYAARFVQDDRVQGLIEMWKPSYELFVGALQAKDDQGDLDRWDVPKIQRSGQEQSKW